MAIEKSKILKNAEKYVAGGKISQAIDEYQKILKENPKDWNLIIQIGDLMLKVNRTSEAIENFQNVADHYYADGFFLKAIAIFKRINKLDPTLTDICMKLADLYLKQGLTMDAKSQLQIVAQHYLSKNQNKDAIETLQKLIEIEPDNLKNRNELAKAYKGENMIPEAIHEYLRIGDELTRKNLFKECLAVLETAYKLDAKNIEVLQRLLALYQEQQEPEKGIALLEEALKLDPSNPEILAAMAEAYAGRKQWDRAHEIMDRAILNASDREPLWELKGDLLIRQGRLDQGFDQYSLIVEKEVQRKDIDRAVTLMQRITEANFGHFAAWQKLVELYTMLRQQANLISAYGNLADAYISKLMYAEAAECLEKLVKLDPDDNQHQEKLKFVSSHLDKTKPGTKKPERVYEVEPEVRRPGQRDLGSANLTQETLPGLPAFQQQSEQATFQAASAAVATKPAAPAAPAGVVVESEEKEFVSEHLIEAEVFNKYGLVDKAIEQLNVIINKYPQSVPTRQKLKEIYLEKGERDRAVEECIQMSKIFRKQGDLDQAEDLLSEARQINPNHAGLERAFKDLTATGAPQVELQASSVQSQSAPVVPPPATKTVEKGAPTISEKILPKAPEKKTAKTTEFPALKKLGSEVTRRLDFTHIRLKTAELNKSVDATAAKAKAALNELEKFAQKIKTQSGTFKLKTTPAPKPETKPERAPVPTFIEPLAPAQMANEEVDIEIEVEEPLEQSAIAGPDFEEVDFFIHQGLLSDAEKALKILRDHHPGHDGIQKRFEQIDRQREAAFKPEALEMEPERPVLADMDIPVMDLPGSLESNSNDEIVISMDDEFGEEVSQQIQVNPQPVGEPLPEISLSSSDSADEITFVNDSAEKAASAQFAEMEDTAFTEFVELEDSAEANMKEVDPAVDQSFVESFNDAVDAVFKFEEGAAGKSEEAQEPGPEAHVKEELFEEEEDFFDLAAELEEGLLNVQSAVEEDRPPDGQNYSIEEILSDFKKGVDKQLGSEDYDTRYNLGIAYKEMGLIDEAIAEFQISAKDPKRLLECCSMLGLCFVEKGMHKLAVKWYQKGLESPGYSEEEYQGLRYDLADAYEALGENERALEVYQEVYGISASYRNVVKKIKDLQEKKSSQM
jgi:tetratricopeptide (TPR) repeat protein